MLGYLCLKNTSPTTQTLRGKFTFLRTCSSGLGALGLLVETLSYHTPFGLEVSSLGVLFWRWPGINNFSNSVGDGNNLGVHG